MTQLPSTLSLLLPMHTARAAPPTAAEAVRFVREQNDWARRRRAAQVAEDAQLDRRVDQLVAETRRLSPAPSLVAPRQARPGLMNIVDFYKGLNARRGAR